MADIQVLGNRILQIEGVRQYMLVRNDGHILIHNTDNPDILSPMIVFCGLGSEALKESAGFSFFKYFMLTRKNREKFIIFPMGHYFLGILQSADSYSPDLIQQIMKLIQLIKKR